MVSEDSRERFFACSEIDSGGCGRRATTAGRKPNMPGGDSAVVPPDPMPNSAVKRRSADGSVGSPHVRVGHCQALILRCMAIEKQYKAPVVASRVTPSGTDLNVARGDGPKSKRQESRL